MRILMTTDTVGGVWTFTRQLTSELLQRDHHVALVSFGRPPSATQAGWADQVAAVYPSFSYIRSELPLEWMQNNQSVYDDGVPVLLSVAERFQPEILLSSQFCFGKTSLNIPRVVVAHSDVLSWARSCRNEPLTVGPWLNQYVELVSEGIAAATAVVAPTNWMLTALASSFTLPQHAVVILNGRSLSVEAPPEATRPARAITAGRLWDEAKNLQILNQIQAPMPIVVAGSTEMESSQAAIDHSAIRFLGELSEPELFHAFQQSSIYICTSKYEPFGLAPLEAALCGCAVIANDIPSLREVWDDCAVFFQDGSTLVAALHKLTDSAALRSAQVRSRARAELLTAERMTERYINLFERLLRCPAYERSPCAA